MKRDPFTLLCRQLAGLRPPRRADLHTHTTASDGDYTPTQVVALARQAALSAIAITDHDTLAAVPEAVSFARTLGSPALEVIPGVEITTEFAGRELHLLGYFVNADHPELAAALHRLCARRRERFRDYITKLAMRGATIPADRAWLVEDASPSLGRRHVAGLLVACGSAKNRHEAFRRFLGPVSREVIPKDRLPLAEAIGLVRAAGGVSSLAHPPPDLTDNDFHHFRGLGLDAMEAAYPWGRSSPGARFREIAARLGLLVTGGSDCHGPDPAHRKIGSVGITLDELERLRERCR